MTIKEEIFQRVSQKATLFYFMALKKAEAFIPPLLKMYYLELCQLMKI